jgi:hypothetical protein
MRRGSIAGPAPQPRGARSLHPRAEVRRRGRAPRRPHLGPAPLPHDPVLEVRSRGRTSEWAARVRPRSLRWRRLAAAAVAILLSLPGSRRVARGRGCGG